MTEYDYSPEAYNRYIQKQQTIPRWVQQAKKTPLHGPSTGIPTVNSCSLEPGKNDLDYPLAQDGNRRARSYDHYDRYHPPSRDFDRHTLSSTSSAPSTFPSTPALLIHDDDANFKEPQQRPGRWSRKSPARSSAQAQLAHDAQSGTAENTGALFDSARNTLINGGQFTAAANVTRNMTINISEGVAPQIQTESCHSPRTTSRSRERRKSCIQDTNSVEQLNLLQRPQRVPTRHVQTSNEIYVRHLGEKGRGHPLWIPQPNMVLPIPYRSQGVRLGDVGILTCDGGFDFLYNIFISRDDPINPKELPENFVPIYPSIDPTDVRKFALFHPGSYLASSSVAESRSAEQTSDLNFESSASEGAILTMPEGSYSEDLSNLSRLNRYIATHAEDWYRFVNGPRGREAENGDLRVVVGCDKATSWGMAAFADSSLSQNTHFRLKFSAFGGEPSQRNAGNKYIWEHSGVAEVRVGPARGENEELGETDLHRLRNQCLFLRTLKVTLAEKTWRDIFPQTVVVTDQNHSYSGRQDQLMHCPVQSENWFEGMTHPEGDVQQKDYSREAFDRYIRKQQSISKWVQQTKQVPLSDPFTPATPNLSLCPLENDSGYSSAEDGIGIHRSYAEYDRSRSRDFDRHERRGRDRVRSVDLNDRNRDQQSRSPARSRQRRSASQVSALQPVARSVRQDARSPTGWLGRSRDSSFRASLLPSIARSSPPFLQVQPPSSQASFGPIYDVPPLLPVTSSEPVQVRSKGRIKWWLRDFLGLVSNA